MNSVGDTAFATCVHSANSDALDAELKVQLLFFFLFASSQSVFSRYVVDGDVAWVRSTKFKARV